AMTYTSPLGAKQILVSDAPRKGPPEQTVNGTGICCQLRPASRDTAAMMFCKRPCVQTATMFLGLTGFTAINDSKASSSVKEVPGKVTKLSSQAPTALGRDSSISGPRVVAGAANAHSTAVPAPRRPSFNLLSSR